jgi:hypothetical protein
MRSYLRVALWLSLIVGAGCRAGVMTSGIEDPPPHPEAGAIVPEPDASAEDAKVAAGVDVRNGGSSDMATVFDARAVADAAAVPDSRAVADARPAASTGHPYQPFKDPPGPVCIGADCSGKNPWPGEIDRVRIYNRPLSAAEIAKHAKNEYEPCADSCVAEWTFETQTASGGFLDTTGRFTASIVNGQVAVVAGGGPDGKNLKFYGASGWLRGWLRVEKDPAFDVRNALTFDLWMKRINENKGECPAGYPKSPSTPCQLQDMLDLGFIAFENHAQALHARSSVNGAVYYTAWPPGVPADAWAHVAFTLDASSQSYAFYVNGVKATPRN